METYCNKLHGIHNENKAARGEGKNQSILIMILETYEQEKNKVSFQSAGNENDSVLIEESILFV